MQTLIWSVICRLVIVSLPYYLWFGCYKDFAQHTSFWYTLTYFAPIHDFDSNYPSYLIVHPTIFNHFINNDNIIMIKLYCDKTLKTYFAYLKHKDLTEIKDRFIDFETINIYNICRWDSHIYIYMRISLGFFPTKNKQPPPLNFDPVFMDDV